MTATTTRRARSTKKAIVADVDTTDDTPVVENVAPAKKERKYFDHSNCGHAQKGEAGKSARAKCRRDIRAWLNAENAFVNGESESDAKAS